MPRVLVAEDEKDIQFLYTAWLRREGYEVTTADNGLEAISAFEASGFDIVILDVMMPEVDGLEVCRHIRAGDPHVPILMVSALARPDDVERGLQARKRSSCGSGKSSPPPEEPRSPGGSHRRHRS